MIDLHTHSVFSDGTLTPEQLVEEGRALGLDGLALTDHDTVAGVPRFLAAAGKAGLWAASGVEISADFSPGAMHLLGYFVDPAHPELEEKLALIRRGREDRNQIILEKLQALGFPLTWEEVHGLAGDDMVGRPHFAQALLLRGLVASKQEAFDRYLGRGTPAYVSRIRLDPAESIGLIHRSGGLAVLAHPATLELGGRSLRDLVSSLRDLGLDGIETYYSEHAPSQAARYRRLAQDFDLVATGGSDYHGEGNPALSLGRGFGSLRVPNSVMDALEKRRNQRYSQV